MRGLWMSDEHVGWKEDNCWKETRLPALKAFGQLAVNEGCSVVYNNGDGIDDRAWTDVLRRGKQLKHIADFRSVLDDLRGRALEIVWQRGNHDPREIFSDEQIEQLMGPMTFPAELVHRFPTDDIVSTHGHIFPSRGLSSILPLDEEGSVEELLEERRLRALPPDAERPVSILQTGMHERVARTLDANLKAMRTHLKRTFGGEQLKAALASFEAARLAAAVGAKVILTGHTHMASVETVTVPDSTSGEEMDVLVANSGCFQKKNPTALIVDSDEQSVTLYEYDVIRGSVPIQMARFPGATPIVSPVPRVIPMLRIV